MVQQKFCRECNQRHNCQKIYEQLGNTKSPSVALKIVAAFLLPVMVFIASLVAFEKILAGVIDTKGLQTVFSVLLAIGAVFVCILITKAINRRFNKN